MQNSGSQMSAESSRMTTPRVATDPDNRSTALMSLDKYLKSIAPATSCGSSMSSLAQEGSGKKSDESKKSDGKSKDTKEEKTTSIQGNRMLQVS
jgi:hypothetical protein